ncbi:MAG: AAA family ATPase, partial [Candidatus Poribacteria bacterium]
LSPGQRSSAMLPLILLVDDVPLVIDQPEDNLDNRLVGKMLVNLLADLKEKRQIIVATHNPNIVVSGDAEQVIVLDALSDSKGNCAQTGSIDEKEIIKSVIDLMEGGKEAFLIRERRYGLTSK